MRHSVSRWLVTGLMILLCGSVADAQKKDAKPAPPPAAPAVPAAVSQDSLLKQTAEAVLAVLAAYDQARLDRDADAFLALHAPNAVQCMANGLDPRLWRIAAFSPIGRPGTAALLRQAFAAQGDVMTAYSNAAVRVDVATDAVLVVRRISETYQDGRTGVERRVDGDHSTHILVKVDGAWKILTTIAGLGNPDNIQVRPPQAPAQAPPTVQ